MQIIVAKDSNCSNCWNQIVDHRIHPLIVHLYQSSGKSRVTFIVTRWSYENFCGFHFIILHRLRNTIEDAVFTWHWALAWGAVTFWQGEVQTSAFFKTMFKSAEGGVERSAQLLQPEAQLQADWIWVAVLLLGSILCNSTGQFCLTCKKVTWVTCLNLII